MTSFKNRVDSSSSKVNVYKVGNDYRKRYIQVANLYDFNPAQSEAIQRKLTSSEITGMLNKKNKTLDSWKTKNVSRKINVISSQLKTSLYQFFEKDGVVAIPFELVFYGTEKKIEDKIQKQYPDLVQWDLNLSSLEDLKRYYKMKEEILSGLTDSDYEQVLFHYFESNWFIPNKKFVPWVWYDVRQVGIKPFPITKMNPDGSSSESKQSGLILKGYIYFWGDLWMERYLRDAEVKITKGFDFTEFLIQPFRVPPLFTTFSSGTIFKDWMLNKISQYFKEGNNIYSDLFLGWLGVKDLTGRKVSVERSGIKDIKLIISGGSKTKLPEKILLASVLLAMKDSKKRKAVKTSTTKK